MPGFLHIMRCVGRAVVKNGTGALANLVPFGNALFEIAKDALEEYRKGTSNSEPALRAELEAMAQAPAAEVRKVAEEVASAEAKALPEQIRLTLASTLSRMQDSTRHSLRRPADPSGKTVPAGLSLKTPTDLIQFLPARPPRFKAGDRPLPGGTWVLEKLLGVGGFGEVWKAHHSKLTNITAALKFCLDPEAGAALLNEGANLNHVLKAGHQADIVQLKNAYLDAEPYCLVYEFIEGDDLAGAIHRFQAAKGPLTPDTATRIIRDLARTVGRVHKLSPPIVHRDLKPANVLVRNKEGKSEFLITDFGIGGVAATQALEQTRQGISSTPMLTSLQGAHTPLYASPEQKRGEPPDPRDDVHALGVIWYQLLVGDMSQAPPFDWIAELQARKVDGGIIDLLGHCIAGRAERRPADAAALAEQIQALLHQKKEDTNDYSQLERDVKETLEKWRTKGSIGKRSYFERQGPSRIGGWEAAAQRGNSAAQWLLACCLREGTGIQKDSWASVGWFRRAAESGFAVAQNDLGDCYREGEGIGADSTEAYRWYTQAAEQGFAEAMRNLGGCLYKGAGAEENFAEAVQWYRKAAEIGWAQAMLDLGDRHYYGEGVERDRAEAVRWYRKAAEMGHPEGQYFLGECYFNGDGVEQDYPQAIGWFRKAAEVGVAEAQDYLGYCYGAGKGVKRDRFEAVKWHRKAAEQGLHLAQYNLGCCYEYGHGVEQDLTQAEHWYRKAADQGYKKAKNALKKLEEAQGSSSDTDGDADQSAEENEELREFANSLGMKFALIPAGKFLMGSPDTEKGRSDDEGPQHEVEITCPFYLGLHPVTQEQYEKVMGKNPSHFTRENGGGANHPVEQVSWEEAVEFCRKLSARPEEKVVERTYRLLTEAEWEYACRGGAKSSIAFSCGDSLSSAQANFDGNHPYGSAAQGPHLQRTTPVSSYPANAFGLYDMHGNVWEWCQDWYDENYYSQSPRQDPQGPQQGETHVLRGGGCFDDGRDCRSAARDSGEPDARVNVIGFRVVCIAPRTL